MLGIFNVPPGNRQKSSMKKSLRKKILNFGTNEVLRKISPCNKKSYHFETLFSRTFLCKNVPGKSPIIVENAWEQKKFTTLEKMPLILKTPRAIFNMKIHRRKRLDLIFPRLSTFFLQDFNSCDLISLAFIGSPHILGKKSQESKT